jgi:homoserine dehydrogenase
VSLEDLRRARAHGGTIRQIAHAAYDQQASLLTVWVAPTFVPHTSLFAQTSGPSNAVVVTCRYAGQITMTGQGAGGDAQAGAILSDLIAIARDRAAIVPAPILVEPKHIRGLSEQTFAEAV